MSNVSKFLIVLNLILAGVFLGTASNFLGQKDHVQRELELMVDKWKQAHGASDIELKAQREQGNRLGAENSDLKARFSAAEATAQAKNSENQQLAANIASQGMALNNATAALAAQNATIKAYEETIKSLQDERTIVHQSRDAEKDARVKAEAVQAQLQRQLDDETGAHKAAQGELAAANAKVQSLEAEAEAYRVQYGQQGTVQPAIAPGKVLAVDNGMGLVVVSLGEEDGVKNGYEYIVSRGNQYVATIKITDVQAKKSTGLVVNGMQKQPISANDTVLGR